MKKIPAHTISSPPRRALVYRFVFEHALMRMFVVVLLCSFALQTVERAFASEVVPTESPEALITITDETVAVLTEEVADRIEVSATPDETAIEIEATPVADVIPDQPIISGTDALPTDIFDKSLDTANGSESDSANSSVPTDGEATVDPLDVTDDKNDPPATATKEALGTTTASTTDESVPTLTVESDQMIQFEKTNCLAVEDGSFYCQMATTTAPQAERGLFALPDADGDLEIYVKNGEEMQQITFNTVDDASPYYDPASDSMVWHRIIDERYQIIVYDVASGEETQLTDTSTNNMEPFRADGIIVWQHWAHDAWQIMLYDGGAIEQLTATGEHNLAPVVRNNLVVWHRVMYGEKTIEVYDLSSKAFMTIRDDEGGTITNPRMVLVYDAAMDNGDTITRGYDLVTGEITSFAAETAPIPDEIPEPDATGETRALLTTKTTSEEEGVDEIGLTNVASSTAPHGDAGVATTTGLTLDLSSLGTPDTVVTDEPVVVIPDLVITPLVASTSPTTIPVVE